MNYEHHYFLHREQRPTGEIHVWIDAYAAINHHLAGFYAMESHRGKPVSFEYLGIFNDIDDCERSTGYALTC